jgi:hypothetical protein
MDIHEATRILKSDMDQHLVIESLPPLTDVELAEFERSANFVLPPSFRTFIKQFGSGIYVLYGCQDINLTSRTYWLTTFHQDLPKQMKLEEGGSVPTDSLLCLMPEDSNGGAWCWLPTLRRVDGEVPLAYWEMDDDKLVYKVNSFTEWLEVLITSRNEVIRVLDVEERLSLG